MPLEFLTEHRAAIDKVLEAYSEVVATGERFFAALDDVPTEVRVRVLLEVASGGKVVINHPLLTAEAETALEGARPPRAHRTSRKRTATLPHPKELVIAILKQHPDGIALAEIIEATRGRFTTASKNPDHVVRTIVGQLRNEAYVERDEQGREKLTPFFID